VEQEDIPTYDSPASTAAQPPLPQPAFPSEEEMERMLGRSIWQILISLRMFNKVTNVACVSAAPPVLILLRRDGN
jgi:hypothetical protein